MSNTEINNSLWRLPINILEFCGKATAIFGSDIILGRIAKPIMVNAGLCMANFMPSSSKRLISQVNQALTIPQRKIVEYLKLNPMQVSYCIAPVSEELWFRYLLQQVALRDIPQTLLNKFCPDKNISMDAMVLKALRTFVTAAIFTMLHHQQAECEYGGGVETFIGSLIYSGLIESGEPLELTMTLHMMWNQFMPIIDVLIENGIQRLQ